MEKLNILVVEDGQSQREMLRDFLKEEGFTVSEAENGEDALTKLRKDHFDLVLTDYKMPGMDGMALLQAVKQLNPEVDVVVMTAFGTVETAVSAMKAGASDYINKPIDLDELKLLIERISGQRTIVRENKILRKELKGKEVTPEQIIFRSVAMEAVINLSGRVAQSRATVLIQGESGTGKELIARLLHDLSSRSEKPMTVVNCAALPETLLESELFGHEKGAFTGASGNRLGRFEEADGGTLFLDEIGELTNTVQVKLLRFLQEREFQRIGGNRTFHSDVRVISATNRNLEDRMKEGLFREDLFYRLNVVGITIPPLKERKEDLIPLMDHFLKRFSTENNRKIKGFSSKARDLLMKYNYPGNVRELENILERAVVIARGDTIETADLPFSAVAGNGAGNRNWKQGTLKDAMAFLEQEMVRESMAETGNHQTRAARILGISERMLRYKLKKYGFK
ncbi:MAG: sigma-54-dependent Fis family transcriptional regulator [Deltaproteobacteria bacterium]|nr:sigma-54-dependent Fis family transcriptional regulator [Deltaproteobacteria bacterium]